MPSHDPEDLAPLAELHAEITRLLGHALQTARAASAEAARADRATVVKMARLQGLHDGEMAAMHASLDAQTENSEKALRSREGIGQAIGILMATVLCTPEDAFDLLVKQSQHENRKVVDIAAEIVAQAVKRARPRREAS